MSVVIFADEIREQFIRYGPLTVDWPHKAQSKAYFPPKGKLGSLVWLLYISVILFIYLHTSYIYIYSYIDLKWNLSITATFGDQYFGHYRKLAFQTEGPL